MAVVYVTDKHHRKQLNENKFCILHSMQYARPFMQKRDDKLNLNKCESATVLLSVAHNSHVRIDYLTQTSDNNFPFDD